MALVAVAALPPDRNLANLCADCYGYGYAFVPGATPVPVEPEEWCLTCGGTGTWPHFARVIDIVEYERMLPPTKEELQALKDEIVGRVTQPIVLEMKSIDKIDASRHEVVGTLKTLQWAFLFVLPSLLLITINSLVDRHFMDAVSLAGVMAWWSTNVWKARKVRLRIERNGRGKRWLDAL